MSNSQPQRPLMNDVVSAWSEVRGLLSMLSSALFINDLMEGISLNLQVPEA